MSKVSIEQYNLLIDHNRRWLTGLARSLDIGAEARMRQQLFDHLDLSLKCLERHRDCLVADLAVELPSTSAEGLRRQHNPTSRTTIGWDAAKPRRKLRLE
jgi:hypothetical protein